MTPAIRAYVDALLSHRLIESVRVDKRFNEVSFTLSTQYEGRELGVSHITPFDQIEYYKAGELAAIHLGERMALIYATGWKDSEPKQSDATYPFQSAVHARCLERNTPCRSIDCPVYASNQKAREECGRPCATPCKVCK